MQNIPKIFHQIWLWGKAMPNEFLFYQKTWINHHSDWSLILWNESNIAQLKFVNWNDYDLLSNYAEKSDYLRICILLEYWGVYIDTDFECVQNIEPLLLNYNFVIWKEALKTFNQAFLASIFWHAILLDIFQWFHSQINKRYLCSTDKLWPHYISQHISNYPGSDIHILPGHFLYNKYWMHTYASLKNPGEVFAIHHYNLSWENKQFKKYIFSLKRYLWKNPILLVFLIPLQRCINLINRVLTYFRKFYYNR